MLDVRVLIDPRNGVGDWIVNVALLVTHVSSTDRRTANLVGSQLIDFSVGLGV